MGVYTRPDSKFLWIYLETAPPGVKAKQRTDLLVGFTPTERKANWAAALAVYGDKMAAIGKGNHGLQVETPAVPFNTFAMWYDTHIVPTHKGHVHESERIRRFCATFGALPLQDPDWRERIIEYRTTRAATPTTRIVKLRNGKTHTRLYPRPNAKTINREISLLQLIFAKAVELKHLPRNPLARLTRLPEVTPSRRIMSDDEERRLLAELAPVDRAILIMGTDTLARLSNVLDLRYDDDHGTHLHLPAPKNGVPLDVPVSTRLRAALDAIPRLEGQPYVFHPRRGGQSALARRNGVYKALRRACKRAHLLYGKTRGGITYHWATRRTGATRMIRKGGDKVISVVAQIGGWKDLNILQGIYREVITSEMRSAIETIAPALVEDAGPDSREQCGNETPQNGSKRNQTGQPTRRKLSPKTRKMSRKIG